MATRTITSWFGFGQSCEGASEVAQAQGIDLSGSTVQAIAVVFGRQAAAALRRAPVRAHDVQKDGEELAAQIGVLAVEVEVGHRTFQAILHHVVGEVGIANQAPGIAPQGRDVRLNLVHDMRVHRSLRCKNKA
jgi:hypothetical protein